MPRFFKNILSRPALVLGGAAAISVFSLAAALTAEVAFGLEPCPLCVYQRIPFLLVPIIALLSFILYNVKKRGASSGGALLRGALGLSGLLFLINAAIAFYHSGVERKWWRSYIEGCAVDFGAGDKQTIIENILSAPTAACDEIPWADPVLGLSMANYNAALCLGLGAACLWSFALSRRA